MLQSTDTYANVASYVTIYIYINMRMQQRLSSLARDYNWRFSEC